MVEDHDADEPSATGDSTDSINRRRFTKVLGAGGAAALGSMGIPRVAAASSDGSEKQSAPTVEAEVVSEESSSKIIKATANGQADNNSQDGLHGQSVAETGSEEATYLFKVYTEPVEEEGIERGRTKCQKVSNEISGSIIPMNHIPNEWDDIVLRADGFWRRIGGCGEWNCNTGHRYAGLSFELHPWVNSIGLKTMGALIGALVGALIGGPVGGAVGAIVGAIAGSLLEIFGASGEYTIGVRDYDSWGLAKYVGVVAGDYNADLHYTVSATPPISGHIYEC